MEKIEDRETRYFIDLDLSDRAIKDWGYDQRGNLAKELGDPKMHRVFLTKGQYHKLVKKF